MDSWGAVAQAMILAVCTWYMRRGSKKDTATVIRSTAAQSTSTEILDRVKAVEMDVAIVKQITLKQFGVDHRGPRGE